jgi:hypothetical protein
MMSLFKEVIENVMFFLATSSLLISAQPERTMPSDLAALYLTFLIVVIILPLFSLITAS